MLALATPSANSVYWDPLNLEDTAHPAPSRLRESRGVFFCPRVPSSTHWPARRWVLRSRDCRLMDSHLSIKLRFRVSAELQELTMSGINGDKARFNRLRKQKIARRLRNQEMLKEMAATAKRAKSSKGVSPKAAE